MRRFISPSLATRLMIAAASAGAARMATIRSGSVTRLTAEWTPESEPATHAGRLAPFSGRSSRRPENPD